MGFNRAKSEATSVFLKHPSLVLVGSVSLYLAFGNAVQKITKWKPWQEECFSVTNDSYNPAEWPVSLDHIEKFHFAT